MTTPTEQEKDVDKAIREMLDKYFPTPGCQNCHGDLHQGCTAKCDYEFRTANRFAGDLRSLLSTLTQKHQEEMERIRNYLTERYFAANIFTDKGVIEHNILASILFHLYGVVPDRFNPSTTKK